MNVLTYAAKVLTESIILYPCVRKSWKYKSTAIYKRWAHSNGLLALRSKGLKFKIQPKSLFS